MNWKDGDDRNIEEEVKERKDVDEGHDKRDGRNNEYERTEEVLGGEIVELGKDIRKEHIEMEGQDCKNPQASPPQHFHR